MTYRLAPLARTIRHTETAWLRFLDALLGPRCRCGERVFPKDAADHERIEHAGDLGVRHG